MRPAALLLAGPLLAGPLLAGPGGTAAAQPLPGLYDVTGVAADDVLNVRAAPEAGAPVVGSLAADARGVEVVGRDAGGGWGLVNVGEGSGWAAMRHLAPRPGVWVEGALPDALACFGTEPFWSFRVDAGRAVLSGPDEERAAAPVAVLSTSIPDDPRRVVQAGAGEAAITAVIVPMACSDGMSDRSFGLDVTLIPGGTAPRMLTGCCSIERRGAH
jgi:uncharacterized membrane protein